MNTKKFLATKWLHMIEARDDDHCEPAASKTTWMEPEAEKLITNSQAVNIIDQDQYPSCVDMQNRCVAMLANLYHADGQSVNKVCGTACEGSSEAIMLAGLAMKKRWVEYRESRGKSTEKPNMVMGANVQVCWEKLCRYFDIEPRYVKLTKDSLVMTPKGAEKLMDENTIGVVAILGSTYTGEFEDVAGLDAVIEKFNKGKDHCIGIHVDGASGGFVTPFIDPELKWDFRYAKIMERLTHVTRFLEEGIRKMEHFVIYSKPNTIPVVAFGLTQIYDRETKKYKDRPYTCFDMADKLRSRGWILPAYQMAPDAENINLLRAVIREDFSISMAEELLKDIRRAIDYLDRHHIVENKLRANESRMFVGANHHHTKTDKKYKPGVC